MHPVHTSLRSAFGTFVFVVAFTFHASLVTGADLVPASDLGLRLARGFRVTLYADDNLAGDIQAMTIDSHGDVVVTGPGYIRTLIDRNNDGVADDAVDFAQTPTGGMGLCFDGDDLMFVGDGALWRFRDANGDGRADGAPEKLLNLAFGEHGGHAIRRGPDGAWYVIGGNDSKFDLTQINISRVPERKIEGGALLRLGPDGRGAEVFAHGLRNPYDFDFSGDGDLFTYDSDVERDYFLPWYTPTRMYHIAPGGHHGWRLEGYLRSWARRDYFTDTVDIMEPLDRGSPTGVACYDHHQFPQHYRNGLFALDWTFGRVFFLPLEPRGSTYGSTPEVFLESLGTHGFAPTGIAVGYDGSLFVSSGGRRSRGAVYRIQYVADAAAVTFAANWSNILTTELIAVLTAPQPLAAWSRAWWTPIAERLGPEPFAIAASDNRLPIEQRIRAIEILTEVHEGLAPGTASMVAAANQPFVRARTAWSLGIAPAPNSAALLNALARDASPYVRSHALASLHRQSRDVPLATLQQAIAANLTHPDKRVRQAVALLATDLPDPAWNALWAQQQGGLLQARLTVTLANLWRARSSQIHTAAVETALGALTLAKVPDVRAQAIRLIVMGLGDYHLEKPSVEVYTAYETAQPLAEHRPLVARIEKVLVAGFPSGDATADYEAARLLAMIEASDPGLPGKLIAFLQDRTTATDDFHYLTVLSRLKSSTITNHTTKIAMALLSLDRKLSGLQQRPKQTWSTRLAEITTAFLQRDPRFADAMLRSPEFARAGNLHLVPLLGSDRYAAVARLFLGAVQRTPSFPWNEALVDLLSTLPDEETHPLFRRQLANAGLRERLLIELAQKPLPIERERFVAALSSTRPEVVRACMSALLLLPVDSTSTKAHVATLRLLRSLLKEPKEQTARVQALALLTRLSGQKFTVQETGGELARAYQPVFDWFNVKYPGLLRQLDSDDQDNPAQWDQLYKNTLWNKGDPARGLVLFNDRACATCHSGARPIGPDLGGAAQRLSPVDLMNAIVFPSRDVAPAFRMTTYQMRDGQAYTGLMAFESADGVIIHTGMGVTARLAEADIASRQPSTLSFMPSGLLAGLKPPDLADLHAYLQTLQPGR